MKTSIERPGPTVTQADISRLELRLGASFPNSYRKFLMDFNGGIPTPDTIDVPGHPESPTDVHVLFSIDRPFESTDIEWNWRVYTERLHDQWVPIASDSFGNVFALTLDP